MGSPNTSPLVAITPGDSNQFKALRNISSSDITCNVTVQSKAYGTQTYNLTIAAGAMIQNDCIVNSVVSGTLYGYLIAGF